MTNPEIDEYGNQRWFNSKGEYHIEDGPALIWSDGTQYWFLNGRGHRTDGPAYISPSGRQAWYLNGRHIRSNKDFQTISGISDEDMTVMILRYGNVY